ncbi:MAG TPA: DUF4350 domain-containing protein [Micropepsaceae bacterium]|nr:DUF4350 domain-containing protein [Micropepsaceae bacterium]
MEAAAKPQVFSPRVALALVAIGALSLLAFVVFSAYAPETDAEFDGRPNALSRSAIGFAGLVTFLRAENISVAISRGSSARAYAAASLIVLTPSLANNTAEVNGVTSAGPRLIILPKWSAMPDFLHPGWVQKVGTLSTERLVTRLLDPLAKGSALNRATGSASPSLRRSADNRVLKAGPVDSLQTISGPQWTVSIADDQGRIILGRLNGTQVYVLSDPDLMNTLGLHDLSTARVSDDIIRGLRRGNGPVIFDVTLAGYRSAPNLLRLPFEPPLLGATLCALLAALLMGAHAATRFGKPSESGRVFAFGKQALADNSASLIAMAKREASITPRYAAAIRARVARAIGASAVGASAIGDASAKDAALNELLDRQRPRDAQADPLSQIFAQAKRAEDASDALRVARKLYRWRREMLHGR